MPHSTVLASLHYDRMPPMCDCVYLFECARVCVCVCVCVRACVRVYVCVHVYACLFACRISSCLCHLLRMRAGELGGAHEVP